MVRVLPDLRASIWPFHAASARISPTLPQRQAARIVVRHPVYSAPHPQHHRRLALSNDLAHDQNPAVVVGTRVASSAGVRTKKRAFDRRILVGDEWWRVAHFGAPLGSLLSVAAYLRSGKRLVRQHASRYVVVGHRLEVDACDKRG